MSRRTIHLAALAAGTVLTVALGGGASPAGAVDQQLSTSVCTAPCSLVKTFGAPLDGPAPDATGFPYNGLDTYVEAFQSDTEEPNATAPIDGVIVRWRARAAFGAALRLLVMHPTGDGTFVEAARTPYGTYLSDNPIQVNDDRLPVRAGDRLGLATGGQIPTMGALGALAAMGDGERLTLLTPSAGTVLSGFRLLVQADIEPDADHDGYGDVTQDACPADGTRHDDCTVDQHPPPWTPPVDQRPPPWNPPIDGGDGDQGTDDLPCATTQRGTGRADALQGTARGERLLGLGGRDMLVGLGGDDCLSGGSGDDLLDGGAGNDVLLGGDGRDALVGGSGHDTISGGAGRDMVSAGAGDDTINAADDVAETIDCGPGRDRVRADLDDRLKHCERVTRVR